MPRILIVGGGVIGSAIAYFLLANRDFDGEVLVVERDPTYARASSALSASSIRQQFSCAANIRMSQVGIEFLRQIGTLLSVDGESPPAIGLREPGYLYLATTEGADQLRRNHAVQAQCGAQVALLDRVALNQRFPWLSFDDVLLASLGLSGEGWFDGYGLLQAFSRKAKALGAIYVQGEVVALPREGQRVTAAKLATGDSVDCDTVVNAAGPWASTVARMAGIALPVRARRRTVFVFCCREELPSCPLVIDPSGLWFRPEGDSFICGVPPRVDADDLPLEPDYSLWEEIAWPQLARRVKRFEAVKLRNAWAGYYEFNVFDQNAILGAHPDCANLYFANGFSGHGMQQAPAVGRGIAELLVYGSYQTLDFAEFGFDRILRNKPLKEANVI